MQLPLYSGIRLEPVKTIDIDVITKDFFTKIPDPLILEQRVKFGTSGHRGISSDASFTMRHVVAITQAVVEYRRMAGITGPIFVGNDTHILSILSLQVVLSVLLRAGCEVHIDKYAVYTPTPAISRAIIRHNREHSHQADGLIITPSHNPPEDGDIKYNPTHGGPAGTEATAFIERRANEILESKAEPSIFMLADKPHTSPLLKAVDICVGYVEDLSKVIDIQTIKESGVRLAVDPMGGASGHYWQVIKNIYGLNIKIVNPVTDPHFAFIPPDEDGIVRMDCSSAFSMASLIEYMKQHKQDIGVANDPDGDRHGIVLPGHGLISPNLFLAIAANYLITHRANWTRNAGIGKTVVTSDIISQVAKQHSYFVDDTPVGFKWFVNGLHSSELMFAGEESSGATFADMNGDCWTTDKDGILLCLLAAEIMAKTGMTILEYGESIGLSAPHYVRKTYPISPEKIAALKGITPEMFKGKVIAGGRVEQAFTEAPGRRGAHIGGVKVRLDNGWFAFRPSGTEPVYKIYAESTLSRKHRDQLVEEVNRIIEYMLP